MFRTVSSAVVLATAALGLQAASPAVAALILPSNEASRLVSGFGQSGSFYIVPGDQVTLRVRGWHMSVEHIARASKEDFDPPAAGGEADGHVDLILTNDPTAGATLHIRSRLAKPFYYNAKVVIIQANQALSGPATVCPVQPGQTNTEHWAQPIAAIRIDSIVETKPDDHTCR